ncbi:MAG: hypothetical protein LBU32_19625 [Clostridiales bacterium]|jgi:hypothetical protein|nr:hypothetical protein [Clostridiales bacterium]
MHDIAAGEIGGAFKSVSNFLNLIVLDRLCIAYRYEGSLNDIKNATVVTAWPESEFQEQAQKAYVCADRIKENFRDLRMEMADLNFFQSMKAVGFDSYQVWDMQTIAN